ncbi:MAG: hypothetical protein RJA19_1116 [Bacteroidota bacterium]|jgi:hypothetical protein
MGEKLTNTLLTALRIGIIAGGTLLTLLIVQNSVAEESVVEGEANYGTYLDLLLNMVYAVGVAAAVAAVLFGIYQFFSNIKQKLGTLVGIAAFILLGIISFYVLAERVTEPYEMAGMVVTPGDDLLAGGGLYFSYLLGVLSIVAVIVAEVSRLFK